MPFTHSSLAIGPVKQSPPASPAELIDTDADGDASDYSPIPQLREYQRKAIDAYQDARSRGVSRIGLSAPTGAGKTVVFAAIIRQELSKYRKKKALVVVNSEDLAEQAMEKILDEHDDNIQVSHERGQMRAAPRSQV